MTQSAFLTNLGRSLGLVGLPCASRAKTPKYHLIQTCPLAGFQHHNGEELWRYVTVGDRLELRREPDNPHDRHAIRVDWNGRKLGYIPADQNRTTALMLDNHVTLEARIGGLERHTNPWRRVAVEVWMVG